MVEPSYAQNPNALSVGGELFAADGSPILQTNVNFQVQILDAAGLCALYTETHLNENLAVSKGHFNLLLGQGTTKVNNVDATSQLDAAVFLNPGVTTVSNCAQPTVALNAGDARQIRIAYDLGAGYTTLTPDVPVVSAAYAMIADSVQGKGAADFIQVVSNGSSALTQANTEFAFSATNWPKLQALLNGTSTQYLGTSPSVPIDLNGQRLVNLADPTAAQNAATKNYVDTSVAGKPVDVTAVGPMTGNGSVLKWDATANRWVAGTIDTSATGTAGGDLQGTYPSPTIKNDAITAAKIASSGGGINRLLITDATTGTTVGYGVCALNQVYAWTASGWACTNVSALSPVTSVAGKTGVVTLNAADVNGLGTAALRDTGTAAGQLPQLDASARLPVLDGSQLLNVNAALLQGRAIAATAPTASQVLGWNVSTSQWEPTTPTAGNAGTVTNVAGGTGLLGGPITSTGTLSVDVGAAAGKIVQENASAQITQTAGSAAAPSYSFVGNTASGAYSPGLNQYAVATNGTAALTILASGNVGIGETASNMPLSVARDLTASAGMHHLGGFYRAGGNYSQILAGYIADGMTDTAGYLYSANNFAVITGNSGVASEKMRITAAGTVGIGTTSPAAGLDIATIGTIASAIVIPRDSTTNRPSTPVNGMLRYNNSVNAFEGYANGAWSFLATGTSAGGGATSFPLLANPVGTAAAPAYSFNGSANTGMYSPGAGQLALSSNGTASLTVSAAGYVGIGTTSPSAQLTVTNASYLSPQMLISDGTTANPPAYPGSVLPAFVVQAAEVNGSRPLFFGYSNNGNWDAFLTAGACGSFGVMCFDMGSGGNIYTALQSNGAQLTIGGGTSSDGTFSTVNFQNSGTVNIGSLANTAPLVIGGSGGVGLASPAVSVVIASNNTYQSASVATDGNLTAGHGILYALGRDATTANNAGYLAFMYQGSGSTNNYLSLGFNGGVSPLNITAAGLIGIGTTAPAAGLDIATTGTIGSAMILPRDSTANRPSTPVNGMLRYNNTANALETYANGAWSYIATGTSAGGGATSFPLLANPIGTAAAPAYAFGGNANTGLYSPGANQVAIATNGSAALTIAGNGDAVFSSTTSSNNSNSGAVRIAGGLGVAGQISAGTVAIAPRLIAYAGTGGPYAPSASLAGPTATTVLVQNPISIDGAVSALFLQPNNAAANAQNAYIGAVANTSGYTPTIVFGQQTGISAYNERMRIDAAGNVGIGTATPATTLDVRAPAATPDAARFFVTGQADGGISVGGSGSSVGQQGLYANAGDLYLTTGSSERFRIRAGGQTYFNGTTVGFGTASPATQVDINGAESHRGIAAPSVSPAGQGRIYFDSTANKYRVSQNGGAYVDLLANGTAGTVTSITAGTGLLGGAITTSGTVSVDVGASANKIPQLNANAQLGLANGTVALPTYSFAGDTTSGMYQPTSGALALAANGTARLTMLSNGGVGVGTATPTQRLHVATGGIRISGTSASNPGNLMLDDGITEYTGNSFQIQKDAAAYWAVKSVTPGNDMAMFVDNTVGRGLYIANTTGNVGVGTTSPGEKLTIFDNGTSPTTLRVLNPTTNANASAGVYVQSDAGQLFITQGASTNNSGYSVIESNAGGSMYIRKTSATGDIVFTTTTSYTPRLAIQNGGNVGIGTTSPGATLDVNGGLRAGAATVVTATCNSSVEGTQRYNYSSHAMEFCDGTGWMQLPKMAAGSTANVTANGPPTSANTYTFTTASINFTPSYGSAAVTYDNVWPTDGTSSIQNSQCLGQITGTNSVTWDLGSIKTINNVYIDGDGGQGWGVTFSSDGSTFTTGTTITMSGSAGTTRYVAKALSPNVTARYIRILQSTGAGDGRYFNICEFAVGP